MDGFSIQVSTTGVAGALASNQVARNEQVRRLREARFKQTRGVDEETGAPDAPIENSSEIVDIDSQLPDKLGASEGLDAGAIEAAREMRKHHQDQQDPDRRSRLNVTA